MNSVQHRSTIGGLFQFCLSIVSLITVLVLMLIPDDSGNYSFLFILPLGHCVLCAICFEAFRSIEKSIGRLIIFAGYTVRNVITPLFICLGNYEIATIPNVSKQAILWAVIVMLYESIIVFIYLNNYIKKHKKDYKTQTYLGNRHNYLTLFSVISVGITLIMLSSLYIVPGITDSYKNLWITEEDVIIQVFSTIQDYAGGSVERLLYAFFSMFFSVMQIIWSIKLIEFIRRIFNQKIIGVILSFGVIFVNTFWVSETSAYTLFVIVILGLNVFNLYPQKKKLILTTFALGAASILVLMVVMRANTYETIGKNAYAKFATFLNAYFPGVANVSALYGMKVPSRLTALYYDLYKGIPLQSLIPPLLDGERLSDTFNKAIGSSSQILPFVGQTFYYLGIFGPIIQVAVIRFVIKFENKARCAQNNIEYLAYTTGYVILAAGCTMYDITILIAFALKTIIPFIVLANCKKIKVKIRK